MRSKLRAFLAIGVVSGALTACSDQPTSAPNIPRLAGANAIENIDNDCNFSDLRAAVRDYVAAGNDVIYSYIRGMGTAPYAQGMNALARLAEVRGTPGAKKSGATPTQGGAAVMEILACMPVGAAVQENFATNIVAAMGVGGMFEVPTTGSTDPIWSRGEAENTPFWTAKPAGGASWGDLTGGIRYMVFGYKIPSNGFDYNVVPMLGAELGAVDMPAHFTGNLLVGSCGDFGDAIRAVHVNDVLVKDELGFCAGQQNSPPLASLSSGIGTNFASFVRKGLNMLAPQPAYAVFGGGVGGAISELSPTNLLTVAPKLVFKPQPATNKSVGEGLGIKVFVFTVSGVDTLPLNNAEVTLTVTGNSGLAALFFKPGAGTPTTGTICFQVTRTTQAPSGLADFSDIGVAKSGGYTLTAAATFDELDATAVVSNLFNVKNKKITTTPGCPL